MIKDKSYKNYRNKIIEQIRQSKQHHFELNKKDFKTIWQGIHRIIFCRKKVSNVSAIIADDNTITDPIKIAKNVNSFFTSIMSIVSLHQ